MEPGERKLATVRRVHEKQPIEGADKIELVMIDGWQVVAKKDEFAVGDQCVYFEIDSFLPVLPQYEFLRKGCFRQLSHGFGQGFRLKTIRLRGQISQGLALPFASLPLPSPGPFEDGADLTELLNVRKFDPCPPSSGKPGPVGKLSNFPAFIERTDQERVQNCWRHIIVKEELKQVPFEVTLKMDGCSMTVYFKDGKFGLCSRNFEIDIADSNPANYYVNTCLRYQLEERLRALGRNIALQGELMGVGCNGNRERLTETRFYLFDVVDIDQRTKLLPAARMQVLEELNRLLPDAVPIPRCPVIDPALMLTTFKTVADCLQYAERPSLKHAIAEGVVFKSTAAPPMSFKAISNRYLLKCED